LEVKILQVGDPSIRWNSLEEQSDTKKVLLIDNGETKIIGTTSENIKVIKDAHSIMTDLHQVEMEHYQAIVAEVESYLDSFAAPLQATARPLFQKMAQGEFSQIAALLPYWLSDLVPISPEVVQCLGVVQLYLWWYYHIQDELLDHNAPPAVLLSGHLALLKAVDIYESLGLPRTPCWADFQRLTLTCAETTARELQTRFTSLDELTSDRLAPFTIDFLINQVTTFHFTTIAQLHLAGVSPNDSLHHDVMTALRCFAAARQLGDDASDWVTDLQAGQLNYVSAHLIRRLYQRGLASSGNDLDTERLVGYQLTDEAFWSEIEQTAQSLSQQALDHLSPYGDYRLCTLIQLQMEKHAEQWAASRAYRANLRKIFGNSSERDTDTIKKL
jgi:hypothetical protein